ncbi:hypothetical protein G4412_13535 [Coprococcus comes]|nr:hypothetical protein [Coprococcus comes]NSC65589.1 hypothetical protein [Agathobacter rectalis]NSC19016.1 hypothetical protein [Coprococcus comes]NSC31276.1 hypothetical protein [Coprococcus comes]NSC68836.1 hypothetical protein [Coprococcus comes]
MLLATYQPKEPQSSHQNPRYDCFRDKLDGEYPVFCFPARTADEFRFRSLLAAPWNREGWLSKFKRNDPCPCGSGKKLKKCHGLKPIELFPF